VPRGNSKNDVVWARNVKDVPPIEQDHTPRRCEFGLVYLGRTSLHFYDGNLNGERYRELSEDAHPEMQQIFGDGRSNTTERQPTRTRRPMSGLRPMSRTISLPDLKENGPQNRQT